MLHVGEHVGAVVAIGVVRANAHGDALIDHLGDRRDPGGQILVAYREIRDTHVVFLEQPDIPVLHPDTMPGKKLGAEIAQVGQVLRGTDAVQLCICRRFGNMGREHGAVLPGQTLGAQHAVGGEEHGDAGRRPYLDAAGPRSDDTSV